MNRIIQQDDFEFTVDQNFPQVITNCKSISRKNQAGTWIIDEVKEAYIKLHHAGYAHSAEAWFNNQLVGGLYGVRLGNVFFGESMFSKVSNASKFAFIQLVKYLQEDGVALIDCQVYTAHLESLGAEMIERKNFMELLSKYC